MQEYLFARPGLYNLLAVDCADGQLLGCVLRRPCCENRVSPDELGCLGLGDLVDVLRVGVVSDPFYDSLAWADQQHILETEQSFDILGLQCTNIRAHFIIKYFVGVGCTPDYLNFGWLAE